MSVLLSSMMWQVFSKRFALDNRSRAKSVT
jgi:hypothetical protein